MNTVTDEAYRSISAAYDFFNQRLFEGKLPECIITYQRRPHILVYSALNRFTNKDGVTAHEFAVNPSYFASTPLQDLMCAVVHEQTHIWQAMYGQKKSNRSYHNKEFALKIFEIGILATIDGTIFGSETGEHIQDVIVEEGKFNELVKEWLQSKEGLVWFDRFPASAAPSVKIATMESILLARQTKGKSEEKKAEIKRQIDELPPPAEQQPEMPSVPNIELPQPASTEGEGSQAPKPGRAKFECPKCEMRAWAKPTATLGCLKCNLPLIVTA